MNERLKKLSSRKGMEMCIRDRVYSAGIVEKTVESPTGFHDIRCYMQIIHSV